MIGMKRHIICVLCLLVAGIGCVTAVTTSGKAGDGRGVVTESSTADIISRKGQPRQGKVTFRCRIVREDGRCMMLARIERNDSAVHIVSPGVTFMLSDGGSVTLRAVRPRACCSGWSDGSWYNAAFRLGEADVERLSAAGMVSVSLTTDCGTVSRKVAPGREDAVRRMLQSLEGR